MLIDEFGYEFRDGVVVGMATSGSKVHIATDFEDDRYVFHANCGTTLYGPRPTARKDVGMDRKRYCKMCLKRFESDNDFYLELEETIQKHRLMMTWIDGMYRTRCTCGEAFQSFSDISVFCLINFDFREHLQNRVA